MKIQKDNYYINNAKYTKFLNSQDKNSFIKYSDFVIRYSNKKDNFLDVGCGAGILLSLVSDKIDGYGIEISKTSVELCRKKKLKVKYYDGKKIPFDNYKFNLVGSINVLEHTQNPISFLNEQYRVLKKNGLLFVICPNFLSTTNSYHWHTQGLKNKILNFFTIILKLIKKNVDFNKMDTIVRDDFHEDDDACVVTNPIDILNWGKSKKMERVYWSSQEQYTVGLKNILDRSFFRYFLGASFIIFKKV